MRSKKILKFFLARKYLAAKIICNSYYSLMIVAAHIALAGPSKIPLR